jgi:hypothetical protein
MSQTSRIETVGLKIFVPCNVPKNKTTISESGTLSDEEMVPE